jgi:hypothetical protein
VPRNVRKGEVKGEETRAKKLEQPAANHERRFQHCSSLSRETIREETEAKKLEQPAQTTRDVSSIVRPCRAKPYADLNQIVVPARVDTF